MKKEFILPEATPISFLENNHIVTYFAPTYYWRSHKKRVYIGDTTNKYGIRLFKQYELAKQDAINQVEVSNKDILVNVPKSSEHKKV